MMNKWNTIESAPKDKLLLLNIGFPWAAVGMFTMTGIDTGDWLYAGIEAELLGENEGKEIYCYNFSNEWGTPTHWMPLPDLPNVKKK